MDVLRIIAENKIETAAADGAFDNLEGKGKLLVIQENPRDDGYFLANHILKNSGHLPVWLEERREICEQIDSIKIELSTNGSRSVNIRNRIFDLNRRISGYNLRIPIVRLQLQTINIK